MLNILLTILISFLISCVICFKLIYTGDYKANELRSLEKVFSSPLFIAVLSILLAIFGVILFSDNIPSVLVFTATLSAAYFASYFSHYFQTQVQRENTIKEEVRARAIGISEELFRLNSMYSKIVQHLIAMEGQMVSSTNSVNSSDAVSFLNVLNGQPNVAYFTLPKFSDNPLDSEARVMKFDINGVYASQKISQAISVFNTFLFAKKDYAEMIIDLEGKISEIGEDKFVALSNQNLEAEFGKPAVQKVIFRAQDLVNFSYSAELQVRETLNYIRENYEVLVRGSFESEEVLEYMGAIILNSGGLSETLDSWAVAKSKIMEKGFLEYI